MGKQQKIVWDECTPEQQAHAKSIVQEWIGIARSTGRMSEETKLEVEVQIRKLYRVAGLREPKTVKVVASPFLMAVAGGIQAWIHDQTDLVMNPPEGHIVDDEPKEQTVEELVRQVLEAKGIALKHLAQVLEYVQSWFYAYQGGNMWPGVCAYVAATRDALGLWLEEHEAFKPWEALARISGYRFLHADFALVSEFPTVLEIDENNEPHCETGPSHRWGDGWELYHIHGVRVPRKVVMAPETITVEEIRDEENAEVKRIMRERYGDARYLTDIGARVVDVDSVPVDTVADSGNITRALMEDDEGNRWLVGSDGSTSRVYCMRVPSEVQTCKEAADALAGVDTSKIIMEG